VVNVADGTDVDVRLGALELLLGHFSSPSLLKQVAGRLLRRSLLQDPPCISRTGEQISTPKTPQVAAVVCW
jgi:hypothetical protein